MTGDGRRGPRGQKQVTRQRQRDVMALMVLVGGQQLVRVPAEEKGQQQQQQQGMNRPKRVAGGQRQDADSEEYGLGRERRQQVRASG